MRSLAQRLALVFVAVATVASAGCGGPRYLGREEAARDLASGRLCIRVYGLLTPWFGKYAARAKAKLGVEVEVVAGCLVDEELVARTDGYNERMDREIEHRFGRGALAQCRKEARAEHEREYGPESKR